MLVNTAVIGDYTQPNVGVALPGILATATYHDEEINLLGSELRTIIHNDFASCPSSLMSQLQDVDACIYALGTVSASKSELTRLVNMDYTLAATRAFVASLAPQVESRKAKKFPLCTAADHTPRRTGISTCGS